MLKIIPDQSAFISLYADTSILPLQLLVVLLRKLDWSSLKFLLLIAGFCLFNLINALSNDWKGDQYKELLVIISSGSAFILAAYYLYYIVTEFELPRIVNRQQKYFLLSLGCAFGCGVLTVYFQSGSLRQVETTFILLPLIAAFFYCLRLEIRVRRTDAIKREGSQYIMIYSAYVSIILITATPVIGKLNGRLDFIAATVNVLFLITAVTYFYRFILSHRAAHEKTPEKILHHREVALSEYRLTPRELEIALLMLDGFSFDDIRKKLFTGKSTVTSQAHKIYKKTKSRNMDHFKNKFSKPE